VSEPNFWTFSIGWVAEALVVDGVDALTTSHLEARVVDQDVETIEHLGRLEHDPVARVPLAEVGLVRHTLASRGLDQLDRLLGIRLLLGHEGEGDVGALPGERERHRATDAGVATGDECSFALEAAMALVGVLAVVRPRLHLVGEAGRFLLLRREGLVGHDPPSSGSGIGTSGVSSPSGANLGSPSGSCSGSGGSAGSGWSGEGGASGAVVIVALHRPVRSPGRIVSFQPLLDRHPASHRLSGDATGRDGR
jgi:hypothetical protein